MKTWKKLFSCLLAGAMALSLAFQAFAYGLVWLACGAALSRFLSRHQRPANAVMALLLVYCAWKILR